MSETWDTGLCPADEEAEFCELNLFLYMGRFSSSPELIIQPFLVAFPKNEPEESKVAPNFEDAIFFQLFYTSEMFISSYF